MPLEPRAALETAVVNRLLSAVVDGGLAYTSKFCGRRFRGYPPQVCPIWFAAVWTDGEVQVGRNQAALTALDEQFSLYITITVPCSAPPDRWYEHQDYIEAKANDIRTNIHKDIYGNAITNAANTLAGFRRADLAAGATSNVGFWRGLAFEGADAIQEVGPDWFRGDPEAANPMVGLTQRLRFGGIARLQDLSNME